MFMAFRRCTHLPATPPKCQLMRGGPGVSRPIKLIDHGATKKKGRQRSESPRVFPRMSLNSPPFLFDQMGVVDIIGLKIRYSP